MNETDLKSEIKEIFDNDILKIDIIKNKVNIYLKVNKNPGSNCIFFEEFFELRIFLKNPLSIDIIFPMINTSCSDNDMCLLISCHIPNHKYVLTK